ncbi:hypothetical protein PoB_005713400 [Plakobranchus ocellatus]|uniref:Uncharacterized protein n=1 Tax=Plakobranchus ocellatus TaxID=259542 RepID=A0AAV4CII5_9GAST|nr:hypothetical protein PoB_005713400 [Plakobranchus ocellatus]
MAPSANYVLETKASGTKGSHLFPAWHRTKGKREVSGPIKRFEERTTWQIINASLTRCRAARDLMGRVGLLGFLLIELHVMAGRKRKFDWLGPGVFITQMREDRRQLGQLGSALPLTWRVQGSTRARH